MHSERIKRRFPIFQIYNRHAGYKQYNYEPDRIALGTRAQPGGRQTNQRLAKIN